MSTDLITTGRPPFGRADRFAELRERLMAPVDAGGLAVLRVGIGGLIAWEVWREIDNGFVRADYVDPRYLFRWSLLEWVKPLPDTWLIAMFVALAISGLFVAFGLYYRTAAVVMSVGMTYWFLLEKARYLNHHYLACLFAFLLVIVPAHAAWSMDAQRKPWVRSDTVPAWTVWLLRFQVGVPYFFAGVAKLNFDWLGRGEPLGMWLSRQTDFPVIGAFFTSEPFVRVLAFGSTALDLSVPFLLLHKRTRAPAYGAALAFHFMNSRLFNIGMFPWMMILATTIFFDQDWPRRIVRTARSGGALIRGAIVAGFAIGFVLGGFLPRTFSGVKAVIGGVGVAVFAFHLIADRAREPSGENKPETTPWRRFAFTPALAWFLFVWVAVQLLLPVRHFAISGNAHWTEEGNRFSWHMLLHDKKGTARFSIMGPEVLPVEFVVTDHLTDFQIQKMVQSPDMLLQFAHYIEEFYRDFGVTEDIEVRVDTDVSLNGRERHQMIDPDVDLTSIRRPYMPPARWILPLPPYS